MPAAVDLFNLFPKKTNNISFLTGHDRETYPQMAHDRLGNELMSQTNLPNVGPASYDNDEKTSMVRLLENQVMSEKGYTMGARTSKRLPPQKLTSSLAPCDYQRSTTKLKTFVPSYEPFLVKCERFPVRLNDLKVTPGPGMYDHDVKRHKHVEWHQSFGGRPINLPPIEVQSTIKSNTKKLYGTNEENMYQRKLAYFKLYY